MRALHRLCGLYRNNTPGGFGFDISGSHDALSDAFDTIMATAAELKMSSTHADILRGLESFATRKDELDRAGQVTALGYVVAAERAGLLPDDDFNGFVKMSIQDRILVADTASHLEAKGGADA